jgi:predicted secreted protein
MSGPLGEPDWPAFETAEQFEAAGNAGQAIALPIANGPATGYAWRLSLPQGVERIEDGPARPIDPSAELGGAAGGSLRVRAPAGDHVITAHLVRPWQPDKPVRVAIIRLHIV